MRSFLHSLLLFLAILSVSSAMLNPGVKLSFTQEGLTEILDQVTPYLEAELLSVSLPPVTSGTNPQINLTELTITEFSSSLPLVEIEENGFYFCIGAISMNLHSNWNYRLKELIVLTDSGSLDAGIIGSSICGTINASLVQGDPIINITNVKFSIQSWNLKINGTFFSWLYNALITILSPIIRYELVSIVEDTIEQSLSEQIDTITESLSLVYPFEDIIEFVYAGDYGSFVADTSFTVGIVGKFKVLSYESLVPPYVPATLPDTSGDDQEIEVFVDQSVIGNLAWSLFEAGVLKYAITQDLIPKSIPLTLNTNFFRFFVPNLYNMYPNWNMSIQIRGSDTPVVTMNPKAMILVAPTLWRFEVVDPTNGTVTGAFVLNVAINITGTAGVAQNATDGQTNLTYHLATFATTMSVNSTNIGTVSTTSLQNTINVLVSSFVFPQINKLGLIGIPLPIPKVFDLVDPVAQLHDGYAYVGTGFQFNFTRFAEMMKENQKMVVEE